MDNEKFTRAALRGMRDGDTRTFGCDDVEQLYSVASSASMMQHVLQCKFECRKDFAKKTITITRLPKGVAKITRQ